MAISPYEVQVMGNHLRIRRRDGKPVRATWDVLQRIKNDFLGSDVMAVEVFPATEDVVFEANIRHMFLVPEGVLPRSLHGWG